MTKYQELYNKYLKERNLRQNLEAKILNFSQILKKHFEINKDDTTGIIRANYNEYFEVTTQRKGIIE